MTLTVAAGAPKCWVHWEKPHMMKQAIAEALPKFHGALEAGEQKMGGIDDLPWGPGSANKAARSKNAKILASWVLTLTMDSNKSLNNEPNN
jgi:hypothetical protein